MNDPDKPILLWSGDGKIVLCTINCDLSKEDAALIVRAVNSHDALVGALQDCLAFFDEKWPGMDFGVPQKAREALAAATK